MLMSVEQTCLSPQNSGFTGTNVLIGLFRHQVNHLSKQVLKKFKMYHIKYFTEHKKLKYPTLSQTFS